ncbi:DUF2971 domain-containing protein [Flavobacteriaceae bacterium LMO-SS05]
MKNSNRIYYYCSLKTAIEFILPSNELLLNPVGKSNDPRENKSYSFALQSRKDLEMDFNIWKFNEELSEEIRKGTKMTCFSTDNGIIKGYGHSRMWALYGDNHKGICLEVDEHEFEKENAELVKTGYFERMKYDNLNKTQPECQFIEYDSLRQLGLENYVKNFKNKYVDFLFFRKNSEWESENEKRLILFSSEPNSEYCTIKKSLKRIILGIDFNDNYFPSISNLCPKVEIMKLTYWNCNFSLKKID